MEERIERLEARVAQVETQMAVRSASDKHIDSRFDRIETRQEKHDANISRVMWLVIAAIIGGLLKFVIDGGLASAGP